MSEADRFAGEDALMSASYGVSFADDGTVEMSSWEGDVAASPSVVESLRCAVMPAGLSLPFRVNPAYASLGELDADVAPGPTRPQICPEASSTWPRTWGGIWRGGEAEARGDAEGGLGEERDEATVEASFKGSAKEAV